MKKILAWALGVVFLVVVIILPSRLIRISKVECESQFGPCSFLTNGYLENVLGRPLGEAKEFLNNKLAEETQVEEYTVRFNLPSTLKVHVVERKAYVALMHEGLSTMALIDEDGVVIGFREKVSLPILVLADEVWARL